MTGILASGATVEVRRPASEPHPFQHGTVAELRSSIIAMLIAAKVPRGRIAKVLRCSERTCQLEVATTPAIKLHAPPRHANAGRW